MCALAESEMAAVWAAEEAAMCVQMEAVVPEFECYNWDAWQYKSEDTVCNQAWRDWDAYCDCNWTEECDDVVNNFVRNDSGEGEDFDGDMCVQWDCFTNCVLWIWEEVRGEQSWEKVNWECGESHQCVEFSEDDESVCVFCSWFD